MVEVLGSIPGQALFIFESFTTKISSNIEELIIGTVKPFKYIGLMVVEFM
jgi:hypothetical protein